MLRKLTQSVCLLLALTAARNVGAFTQWGPLEPWQTGDLDYSSPAGTVRYYYWFIKGGDSIVELGGPKNFGEGSRLTTPILTYAFDATFLRYFGPQGEAAVDSAMAVLNALPSSSTANLSSFSTESAQQINYTAQALALLDMKSAVLYMMAEHMGLLGETHVYDLRLRVAYNSTPCDFDYWVINYNYDPVTYNPTPYVNGRLYTYQIWDGCGIGVNVGATDVSPADTTAQPWTAVATVENLVSGAYYVNLTRDDMGGLKYLYSKGNYFFQAVDAASFVSGATTTTTTTTTITSPWQPVSTNVTTTVTNIPTVGSNFAGGVLGGVEKITFLKVKYDSALGPTIAPITYNYTIPFVTNFTLQQLHLTRTITAPDIIFTAADLAPPVPVFPPLDTPFTRSGTFIPSPFASPGGGTVPGTITPNMLIVLNNVGPIYLNESPAFLTETNNVGHEFNWASFDGSTNAPIVYPLGSSLALLQQEAVQATGAAGLTGVVGGANLSPTSPWIPVLNTGTNTTSTNGVVTGAVPARVR